MSVLEGEVKGQSKAEILFHVSVLKQIRKSCLSFSSGSKICIFTKIFYTVFF